MGSADTQRGAPGDHTETASAARGVASAESMPGSPQPAAGVASADPGLVARSASSSATSLTLGTYRDLWAGPITELNPPLKFLAPQQKLEISLRDAERLGLDNGDPVKVAQNDSSITAQVAIRERVSECVCFLAEGTASNNANALLNGGPVSVEITPVAR